MARISNAFSARSRRGGESGGPTAAPLTSRKKRHNFAVDNVRGLA